MKMRSLPRLTCGLGLALLLAAGAAGAGDSTADPTPLRHRLLAKTLRAGAEASAHPQTSAHALADAAATLRRSGAVPMAEGEDLATRWERIAIAHGGKAPPRLPLRGRALGAAYKYDRLAANGERNTQQVFLAGVRAVVTVVPTDDASLRLRIGQGDAEAACTRMVGLPQASCEWVPTYTQRYTISVSNPGNRQADYFLIVN